MMNNKTLAGYLKKAVNWTSQVSLGRLALKSGMSGVILALAGCYGYANPVNENNKQEAAIAGLLGIGSVAAGTTSTTPTTTPTTPAVVSASVQLSTTQSCVPIGNNGVITFTDSLSGAGNTEYKVAHRLLQVGTQTNIVTTYNSSYFTASGIPTSITTSPVLINSNAVSPVTLGSNGTAEDMNVTVDKYSGSTNVDPGQASRSITFIVPKELSERTGSGIDNASSGTLTGTHNINMSNTANGSIPFNFTAGSTYDIIITIGSSIIDVNANGTALLHQLTLNDLRCLKEFDTGLAVNTSYSTVDLATGAKYFIVIGDQNVAGDKHVSLMRVSYVSFNNYQVDVIVNHTAVTVGPGSMVSFDRGD